MTARRIVDLGLGLLLEPAQVTATTLRASVAKVLADEAIRAQVAAIEDPHAHSWRLSARGRGLIEFDQQRH